MALETRKSNPSKPVRVLAYGVEGVGKSTLGAKADSPIFITPEGGTDQLTDTHGNPIEEMPDIDSWDKLRHAVNLIMTEDHNFKTLVLDSADWIEGLAHKKIIGNSKKTITTVNGGYGSGYRESQNMHQELIHDLSLVREHKNMNIIVTAHAHVKAVKDPESAHDYDAFEIKCHELVSSLWREWVDGLFFIRFRTFTKVDENDKTRALSDGTRILYTVKQPAFQAKNRYGMPPFMEFTPNFWSQFMKYAKKEAIVESADSIRAKILELIDKIQDASKQKTVIETIEKAGNDIEKLALIRSRLLIITKGA